MQRTARSCSLGTLLLATLLLATPALGQVSVEGGVGVFSEYVWRGFRLTEQPSVQPSATVGYGDVSLNIWGAFAMAERDQVEAADELDFTLAYAPNFEAGGVGLSPAVGYIQYTFPNAPEDLTHSEEVFVGLGADLPLSPSVTYFYDFGLADASYLQVAAGPEYPLGDFTLGLGVAAGFGDAATDGFAFQDVGATASVSWGWDFLTVTPAFSYTFAAEEVNADQTEVFGGITVSAAGG